MAWTAESWALVETASRGKVGGFWGFFVRQDVHQKLRHKQIGHDDQNRGGHNRLRRRSPYPLRASAGRHAIVTTHRGDNEPEQEWLDQTHEYVLKHQRLPGIAPVLASVEVQQNFGHKQSTRQADKIRK